MQPTRISVVIPAYNAEKTLRATLESVMAQTRPAEEVLVIDDGSRDSTEDIARSFGDRVRYIRQTNMGIAGARNTGIQHATGNWIALLDHDDLMQPKKLEVQAEVISTRPNLNVVYSGFEYLYSDESTKAVPAFPAVELWPALRYRTPVLPSTALIRRSALLAVGGFNSIFAVDDWDLWFRLARKFGPDTFQEVDEHLTLYRWWENNASRNFMAVSQGSLFLLDNLLLEDTRGLDRWMWQRKCESRLFYSVAVSLRESGSDRAWAYAIESFLRWPLPSKLFPVLRYRVFLHMLWKRLQAFQFSLNYWWPSRRCREELQAVQRAGSAVPEESHA